MKILYGIATALICTCAHAQSVQQYALELSQPCTMTVYDQDGQPQTGINEPVGYVAMYQWWQGAAADTAQGNAMTPPDTTLSTLLPATDACGHGWNPVLVSNGTPSDGSGGVALTIPPSEALAHDAVAASAQYNSIISAGLSITSTSTPAIDGTYSLTPSSTANFASIEDYVLANGDFPTGATQTWILQNGQSVTIPSVAVFKELATAIAAYVDEANLAQAAESAGGNTSWPNDNVTIP